MDQLRAWTDRQGRNTAVLREAAGALVLSEMAAPAKQRDNAVAHRIDQFLGEMEIMFGAAEATLAQSIPERLQARRVLRERIEQARRNPPSA